MNTVLRSHTKPAVMAAAPPSILGNVLQSREQPLRSTSGSLMELRFGHDFSGMFLWRVHMKVRKTAACVWVDDSTDAASDSSGF